MGKIAGVALALASFAAGALVWQPSESERAVTDRVVALVRIAASGAEAPGVAPKLSISHAAEAPREVSPAKALRFAEASTAAHGAPAPAADMDVVIRRQHDAFAPDRLAQGAPSVSEPPVRRFVSVKPSDDGSRRELARTIQTELKRVGCYDGDVDGTWSPASRGAMKAFIDRLNATLPVDQPDYILLTMLQGHAGRACGKDCPAGQVSAKDGRCQPRAIVAQAERKAAERPLNGNGPQALVAIDRVRPPVEARPAAADEARARREAQLDEARRREQQALEERKARLEAERAARAKAAEAQRLTAEAAAAEARRQQAAVAEQRRTEQQARLEADRAAKARAAEERRQLAEAEAVEAQRIQAVLIEQRRSEQQARLEAERERLAQAEEARRQRLAAAAEERRQRQAAVEQQRLEADRAARLRAESQRIAKAPAPANEKLALAPVPNAAPAGTTGVDRAAAGASGAPAVGAEPDAAAPLPPAPVRAAKRPVGGAGDEPRYVGRFFPPPPYYLGRIGPPPVARPLPVRVEPSLRSRIFSDIGRNAP